MNSATATVSGALPHDAILGVTAKTSRRKLTVARLLATTTAYAVACASLRWAMYVAEFAPNGSVFAALLWLGSTSFLAGSTMFVRHAPSPIRRPLYYLLWWAFLATTAILLMTGVAQLQMLLE